MFTEQKLSTGEPILNFASGPRSGPPLLFLHGLARCWQDFLPLMPALLIRWQVCGLDFRGHGASSRTPDRYLLVHHVGDAASIVRSAFTEPVVLFGHSMGALVAAGVAAQMPERVRAIIVEDPPSSLFLQRIDETMYRNLFVGMKRLASSTLPVSDLAQALGDIHVRAPDGRAAVRLAELRDAAAIRFGARCLRDLDPEVYDPVLEKRWLEGYDSEVIWKGVRCPVLMLRGEESLGGMLPRADADQIAGWLGDCTRVDLPGLGHLIHASAIETTTRLVTGFLESL
jgi:pimeloyl-ACP methyl ester carboxylesterase